MKLALALLLTWPLCAQVGTTASMVSRSARVTATPSPLLTNLIAYWNMDEASGNRADSHTNGLTLTDNATVGSTTGVGAGQTAADFVAANSEYLSRTNATSTLLKIGSDDYTVAMWVYQNAYASKVVWSFGFPASRSGLSISLKGTPGRIGVDVRDNTGTRVTATSNAGGTYTEAAWNLIIVKLDRDGSVLAKINNSAVTSWFASVDISGMGAIDNNSTDPVHVGAIEFSPPSAFFDGRIGPVGVWRRLTTADEDTTLYNSGTAALLYDDL